jgi:hypothetical protein
LFRSQSVLVSFSSHDKCLRKTAEKRKDFSPWSAGSIVLGHGRQNIMAEGHGGAKLLILCWLRRQETDRKGPGTDILQRHIPSDLLPQIRPTSHHLPIMALNYESTMNYST